MVEPRALRGADDDRRRAARHQGGGRARAARELAEAEWEVPQIPEVSDTNFDEYELMERSWAGTIPAGLEIPGRNSRM